MSERGGTPADEPFGGRTPTSHERLSGRPWDGSYTDGQAPWDIGRPQPAIVRAAAAGTVEADRIHTRFHDDGAPAWFATLRRS